LLPVDESFADLRSFLNFILFRSCLKRQGIHHLMVVISPKPGILIFVCNSSSGECSRFFCGKILARCQVNL